MARARVAVGVIRCLELRDSSSSDRSKLAAGGSESTERVDSRWIEVAAGELAAAGARAAAGGGR